MNTSSLVPIFPLNTVLYPGGPLRLRIFERRYLDMIRECSRNASPFGVCQLLSSDDSGTSRPSAVGTLAHITDFYTLENGLLGISCSGGARFSVERLSIRDSGLMLGELAIWEDEPALPVPPDHQPLSTLLARLLDDYPEVYGAVPLHLLADASFVGFRLSELLPRLSRDEQQQLLATRNPIERLLQISAILPRYHED